MKEKKEGSVVSLWRKKKKRSSKKREEKLVKNQDLAKKKHDLEGEILKPQIYSLYTYFCSLCYGCFKEFIMLWIMVDPKFISIFMI